MISKRLNLTLRVFALTIAIPFIVCSMAYAQVYKDVDKKGRVTFTDKKTPDATPVDISDTNTTKSLEISTKPDKNTKKQDNSKSGYNNLTINTPIDGTIIPNGLVPLSVSVSIQPQLKSTHMLQLLVDGKIHSESKTGSFILPSVNRGSHTLQVKVIDINKEIVKQSPITTIFAYRPGGS